MLWDPMDPMSVGQDRSKQLTSYNCIKWTKYKIYDDKHDRCVPVTSCAKTDDFDYQTC